LASEVIQDDVAPLVSKSYEEIFKPGYQKVREPNSLPMLSFPYLVYDCSETTGTGIGLESQCTPCVRAFKFVGKKELYQLGCSTKLVSIRNNRNWNRN
jgi:hypothetical protein